jgi:hypothetical protein
MPRPSDDEDDSSSFFFTDHYLVSLVFIDFVGIFPNFNEWVRMFDIFSSFETFF